MATSPLKGYELQVTGSNSGTWGSTLNTDVFGIIDSNMAGITNKTLSNVNVTLSASESQNCILRLSGVLTGNVQITTACYGFFFVENLTTGAFAVTVTNGAGGVVVPQSSRTTVISDSTNGCRLADQSLIPSGTRMLFWQTSAPTGWTKETGYNNYALRTTSGTWGTGGGSGFTTLFSARTILQANLPNVSFTGATTSTGTHRHFVSTPVTGSTSAGSGGNTVGRNDSGTYTDTDGGHDHTVSVSSGGSGTAMDFAVAYVDVILASKN